MAFERCQKISFQESLEAIKERMKEKRNQNQTKINRAKQTLTSKTKTKALSKSAFLKNIQANNQNLALSLEGEKKKLRVAYDVILSLKKERQAMMFYILMLKRKLECFPEQFENLSLISDSIEEDLGNFRDDLPQCIPERECSSLVEPFIQDVVKHVPLESPRIYSSKNAECTIAEESRALLTNMVDTQPTLKKISRGRRSTFIQSQDSDANSVASLDGAPLERMDEMPKGVSVRRRSGRKSPSFSGQIGVFDLFNTCENFSEVSWASEEQMFNVNFKAVDNGPTSLHSNQESTELEQVQMTENWNPEKVETKFKINVNAEMVSKKELDIQLDVEQRGRRGKVLERNKSLLLKKHLEPARSKSRDRCQSNISTAKGKEKSLDCSDTYNFDYEESTHLTPFRRKDEPSACENINNTKSSIDSESTSDDDLDDSLYVPPAGKRCRTSLTPVKNEGQAVTSRRRLSRRAVILQKDMPHKKGPERCDDKETTQNKRATFLLKTSEYDKIDVCEHVKTTAEDIQFLTESGNEPENIFTIKHKNRKNFQSSRDNKYLKPQLKKCMLLQQEHGEENAGSNATIKNDNFKAKGKNFGPRFSLSDVTNYSKLPTENKEKKMSCPALLERMNKISPIAVGKRRCTMAINYKEPSLLAKLRRGDRYTDTQFLRSPIFKQKKNNASLRKPGEKTFPLSRYNEAFVGCR
ncbi:shugoshin 1-like [Mustelus asterias]